ncbi:MAG: hypothetical protein WD342_17465 [Verrucomicrobiales bacterium]
MRQRFLTFAVLGIILIGIGEWNLRTRKIEPLSRLNDFWREFCVGNAGDRIGDPAVTVVRINDDYEPLSIGEDKPSDQADLTRLDYATILGFVAKLDPKSVAFLPTPSFDESRVLNKTDIVPLKGAAMQLPRLQVATVVSDDGEGAKEESPVEYPTLTLDGEPEAILTFTRTVRHPDDQIIANGDPAFKSIASARELTGEQEIRVPLVARYRDEIVPSIVLTAVADHAGVPLEDIVVDLSGNSSVIRLGELRTIPIAADGTMELPPHAGMKRSMTRTRRNEEGETETSYRFTSMKVEELAYTGNQDDEVAARILAGLQGKFDSIADNLVVIGFDRTADRRLTTATGEVLSETTMLARAMGVIQSGRFIDWWPSWARWLAVLAIAAIALLLFKFSRLKFVVAWLVATLLFFTACVLVFRATLSWTPPFVMFALFGLMLLVGLLIPAEPRRETVPEPEAA